MGIRTKVLMLICVVVLLTGGFSMFIGRTISRDTVEAQIGDLLTTTAQSRSREVQMVLDDMKDSALMVSEVISSLVNVTYREETGGRLDSEFLVPILALMKNSGDFIHEILIIGKDGSALISSNPDKHDSLNKQLTDIYLFGMENPYVGDIFLNEETGEFAMYSAAPIMIDGEVGGVIGILNGTTNLFKITTDVTGLGKTGETYIVNSDGYMVSPSRFVNSAAFDYSIDLKDKKVNHSQDASITSNPISSTITSTNYLDIKVIRSYAEIPEMGWSVVVEKSASEAFSPVEKMTNSMIFILVGLLAAGIIAALLISKTITRPLMKLHKGVNEILNGNLDHSVGNNSRDEIGHLSRAFDEMTNNVKSSQTRLEKYSAGLEEMVAQRTEELSTTNEELNQEMSERERAETKVKEQYNAIQVHNYALEAANEELRTTQEKLVETNAQLQNAVDDLKSSQEQLLQSQKLAAIGELVSGVAHELNNPLMAIQGNAYILLDDVEDEINKESLQTIYSETKRVSEIVQNLLSFSRKQGSLKTRVDINDCVDSTVKLRAYELSVNNIELISEFEVGIPMIMGDAQRLRQVFLNLVNNSAQAIKQHHDKGKIVIKTHQIDHQMIRIIFKDDGPGIVKDVLDRIFEPFFTTKDVGKGTGLGLSICYGIIQDHEGKICAESNPGEGATFFIELPIAAEVLDYSENTILA